MQHRRLFTTVGPARMSAPRPTRRVARSRRTLVLATLVAAAVAACSAAPTDPTATHSDGLRVRPAVLSGDSTQFTSDSTGRGGGGTWIDPNG